MSEDTERAAVDHAARLLDKANVVGVAGGDDKVLVLVTAKRPVARLAAIDVVDRQLDGLDTDVVEVGDLRPMLAPGTSIGLRNKATGTLGAVVADRTDPRIRYGLTNNHVAADSNRAMPLTTVHSPGPADGLGARIGRLGRTEPIYFGLDNPVDAALIRLDGPVPLTHEGRIFTPQVGWKVTKTGRTSGVTDGVVVGRNATVDVDFASQGVARFVGQLITSHMLEPGDSGSVFETRSGFACALGFAGSARVSIATPISTVLTLLSARTS